MKILVIGSGAREHTLVWKLAQSPKIKGIFIAPGNAGTALIGHNLDISASDKENLAKAVRRENIELVVVGPVHPALDEDHDVHLGELESFIDVLNVSLGNDDPRKKPTLSLALQHQLVHKRLKAQQEQGVAQAAAQQQQKQGQGGTAGMGSMEMPASNEGEAAQDILGAAGGSMMA